MVLRATFVVLCILAGLALFADGVDQQGRWVLASVVGVGIGYKISGGKLTNRRAIRIYVDRKLPPDVVPQQFMLPEKIDGIEADVVETGRFRALAVVRVRDGLIVSYDDYMDPIAMAALLGRTDELVAALHGA